MYPAAMAFASRSLLVVFLIALAVRLAATAWFGIDAPPRGDERGYVLLAESLAAGDGFRLPVPRAVLDAAGVAGHPGVRAFRGPLLPLVLAPVAAVGGGIGAMRLLLAVLGACGAPLLFVAARQLLEGRAALAVALAYALWPPHVFVSAHMLSEPLSMALLVAASALASRARLRDGGRVALAAGLMAGLAVLARPAALLPALFLVPVAGDRRRAALLAVGLLAFLAPWALRNQVVLGRPLLTTNSGVTLAGGNGGAAAAAAVPGKWLPPDEAYAGAADAPDLGMWGWSRLGEQASDRRFTADAVSWARENPRDAAVLVGWKLVRLFDPDPRSRKPDARLKAWLGWLTLTPVLLLALAGAAHSRTRSAGWYPWWALLVGTVATAALFYGDTRMRAAADPTLLLLAVAGAGRLLPARDPGS